MTNKIEINDKLTKMVFTKNQKKFNMNEIYCPDCGKLLKIDMEYDKFTSNNVNNGTSKLVGACLNCGCTWLVEATANGEENIQEKELLKSNITSIELIEKELTELNERKTKLFNFIKSENLTNISLIEKKIYSTLL